MGPLCRPPTLRRLSDSRRVVGEHRTRTDTTTRDDGSRSRAEPSARGRRTRSDADGRRRRAHEPLGDVCREDAN
ncbi:unnamed protein product [Arctogadus glacialis]